MIACRLGRALARPNNDDAWCWVSRKSARPNLRCGTSTLLRRHHLRRRRLLLLVQPVEDAAGLDHAAVGVDVGLRRVGDQLEIALLRLEYRYVLEERGVDLVGDHLGGPLILDVPVVRLAPEIVAGALGLRRDGVEIPHLDAADPLAFRRAGASRGPADVEPQERRRREVDDLPAIDMRGE